MNKDRPSLYHVRIKSRLSRLAGGWRRIALGILLGGISSSVGCSDEDHPLDPVNVCEEYCSRSMCPRDATLSQCQTACEAVHERCPRPADVYHRCANSQPLANWICEDDGTTHLAMNLCEVEERNFDDCVDGL